MNADKIPCKVLYRTDDEKYSAAIRLYQGCPTVAATRGGRIYLGWCSGGDSEPHMDNYCLLVYSDNMGKPGQSRLLLFRVIKKTLFRHLIFSCGQTPTVSSEYIGHRIMRLLMMRATLQ
ncbi:MAG: hypothetical protein Q8882_08485 [Bacillota bacterium]|nr:hypothetical protein [Bacillota bacterium]